jgi:DNA mismatch endonuclease, patch repair protein
LEKRYIRDGRAPVPKDPNRSRIMSAIRAKNTKPELKLKALLKANGITGYRSHQKSLPGRPDIAFPKSKKSIFLHGCYWHRCPYCKLPLPKSNMGFWRRKFMANKERDKRKSRELKKLGWKTLTIWECQLKKNPFKVLIQVEKILST